MMNNTTISPDLLHKGSADDVLICAPKAALPLSQFNVPPEVQKKNPGHALPEIKALPYQIHGMADAAVAALCEASPAIERSSSFQFINNADNYFFYRKAHEHVPGTMFIEAARQAVYHHLYTHTNHKRGAVTVSVNELNASFSAYAELMYPIELVVDNMTPTDTSSPKKIHFRVSFYQRQVLFATIDTKATVIDIALFEKTRNIFIYADDWFAPITQSKLVCTIDGQPVTLLAIGKRGCVTTVPEGSATTLSIAYDGKISFTSGIRSRRRGQHACWDFDATGFDGLQQISDMIKRGFVHLDQAALSALEA